MSRDLDAYQQHYGTLPFEATQALYRKRKILESLHRYRPRSILEIGCGFDPIFAHYTDYDHCTVVEPGDRFVQHAREAAKFLAGTDIVHGTLERNVEALARIPYDFIVLSSLLHEITDGKALLDVAARLCGPQTVMHVNVPNARSLHRLLALEMGIIQSVHEQSQTQRRMQQIHTFDQLDLAEIMSRSGFEVIESGTFFIKPFTHAQMASLQGAGVLTETMLDGLYKLSRHFPDNGSEIFMNVRLQTGA